MKKFLSAGMAMCLLMGLGTSVFAAPSYEKGKVLFSEDFSGKLQNWTVNEDIWTIKDGRLQTVEDATVNTEEDSMIIAKQGTKWSNYIVEFDLWFLGDDAGIAGPMFRINDIDNLYMWQLSGPAGATPNTVRKHVRQDAQWAVDAVDIGVEFAPEKKYHVAYELFKNSIKTYVDGRLVNESTDDTFTSGSVGFRSWGEPQAVDNITVTELVAK